MPSAAVQDQALQVPHPVANSIFHPISCLSHSGAFKAPTIHAYTYICKPRHVSHVHCKYNKRQARRTEITWSMGEAGESTVANVSPLCSGEGESISAY